MKNIKWTFLSVLVLLSMALAACAPQQVQVPVTVVVKETQVVSQVQTQVVKEVQTQVVSQVQVVTATPVPPTAAPPAKEVKPVDSVVFGLQQEPDTLHPYIGSMMARTAVLNPVFPECMAQNEKLEWVPLGCETVPTLDNGGAVLVGDGDDKHLEVTYKIRKDWRWTDGTPVTSKDAVYYWKLIMDPKFEVADRTFLEKNYDWQAVDDQTVVIKWMSKNQLKAAVAGTLKGNVDFKAFQADYEASFPTVEFYAMDPSFWIAMNWLPEHLLASVPADQQAASDWAKKPVGDGPYVVQDWKPGQEIVLTASDKPFALGTPKIKTITFRIIADVGALKAALENGEIDAALGSISGLSSSDGPDLDALAKGGVYAVDTVGGYQVEHIDLNTTKFPLDDVKVRQALYMALDRQKLVDTIYYGKKTVTDLLLPKGIGWAYPKEGDITPYKFDLDGAKAMLKDAGWDCSAKPCTKKDAAGKTVKLEFTLMTTDRADRQTIAQAVQAMWGKLNVGVNIQILYGRGLFATGSAGGPLSARTFDAAIYTWITDDNATYYTTYSCTSIPTKENGYAGQNYPGWCNKAASDALNQSENNPEVAGSHEKRLPFLLTFFKEQIKEVPVIFLWGSTDLFPHLVNWKNWKPGGTQYSFVTWNAWEWEVSK